MTETNKPMSALDAAKLFILVYPNDQNAIKVIRMIDEARAQLSQAQPINRNLDHLQHVPKMVGDAELDVALKSTEHHASEIGDYLMIEAPVFSVLYRAAKAHRNTQPQSDEGHPAILGEHRLDTKEDFKFKKHLLDLLEPNAQPQVLSQGDDLEDAKGNITEFSFDIKEFGVNNMEYLLGGLRDKSGSKLHIYQRVKTIGQVDEAQSSPACKEKSDA